ncbi:uncharacterized protein LOC126899126 [Daktulosphaira vitifoliae]|uniref:uncharacterized protein LOC126899126 n=1 Tax=Daktulosphaira vitifoliae TaxID=58002 RepID=UPI0021A9ED88|nr:uncharacterized protein LOC126899126 [Daktulosphaira vitifoliae]
MSFNFLVNLILICMLILIILDNLEATKCSWPSLFKENNSEMLFCEFTYNAEFIKLLPKLNTMDNKKFSYSRDDINKLTTRYRHYRKETITGYKKKLQSVQCTIGVIVKYLLDHYKKFRVELKNGTITVKDILELNNRHLKQISNMLSVFYQAKTAPHPWLWWFYSKLYALKLNSNLIENDYFDDEILRIEILNFLKTCEANHYLPKTLADNSFHIKVQKNVMVLTNEMIGPLFENKAISTDFNDRNKFVLEDLLLILKNPENFLFGSIIDLNIIWGGTSLKLEEAKLSCIKYLKNRNWVNEPFVCNDYHDLIALILQVRLLSYAWKYLYIYRTIIKSIVKLPDNEINAEMMQITIASEEFYLAYMEAIDYIDPKDKIFWRFAYFLQKKLQTDEIILDAIIKSTLNEMISRLISLSVNNVLDNMKRSSILNNKEELTTKMIRKNTFALKNEIFKIKQEITPWKMFFINFYRKGNISFHHSFYYNEQMSDSEFGWSTINFNNILKLIW